jgi:acyl-CoA synthetase (AMP-forming)/AMP-acid ligase II
VTNTGFTATIGVPLPCTWLKCLDDGGREVPLGQPGEIAIKGLQLMAGCWQRPDETANVMTPDGYFKSGDIGTMDARLFHHRGPQGGHGSVRWLQRLPQRDWRRCVQPHVRARMRSGGRARRKGWRSDQAGDQEKRMQA